MIHNLLECLQLKTNTKELPLLRNYLFSLNIFKTFLKIRFLN